MSPIARTARSTRRQQDAELGRQLVGQVAGVAVVRARLEHDDRPAVRAGPRPRTRQRSLGPEVARRRPRRSGRSRRRPRRAAAARARPAARAAAAACRRRTGTSPTRAPAACAGRARPGRGAPRASRARHRTIPSRAWSGPRASTPCAAARAVRCASRADPTRRRTARASSPARSRTRTSSGPTSSAATRSSSGAAGTSPSRPSSTPDEAATYWHEVLRVGPALERHLEPVKLNYNVLGNSLPHLHTHVLPRYADDPRPGWPFPFPEEEPPPVDEAVYRRDVEALRRLLALTYWPAGHRVTDCPSRCAEIMPVSHRKPAGGIGATAKRNTCSLSRRGYAGSMAALDVFTPRTRAWFERAFDAPTPAQAQGWPAIASGAHTLIQAPTGSGKTLAAFLYGHRPARGRARGGHPAALRLAAQGAELRRRAQPARPARRASSSRAAGRRAHRRHLAARAPADAAPRRPTSSSPRPSRST